MCFSAAHIWMELELMDETRSSPASCIKTAAGVRKILQCVGRTDACVTSLALTQSSRGPRTEVMLDHAHKTALTLMYGEEWKGHRMLFCLKDLEVSRCKRRVNSHRWRWLLSQVKMSRYTEGWLWKCTSALWCRCDTDYPAAIKRTVWSIWSGSVRGAYR